MSQTSLPRRDLIRPDTPLRLDPARACLSPRLDEGIWFATEIGPRSGLSSRSWQGLHHPPLNECPDARMLALYTAADAVPERPPG